MIPILDEANSDLIKKLKQNINFKLKPRPSISLLDLLLWPQLIAVATLLLPTVDSPWVQTSITSEKPQQYKLAVGKILY